VRGFFRARAYIGAGQGVFMTRQEIVNRDDAAEAVIP
jgi:hypothetical protein